MPTGPYENNIQTKNFLYDPTNISQTESADTEKWNEKVKKGKEKDLEFQKQLESILSSDTNSKEDVQTFIQYLETLKPKGKKKKNPRRKISGTATLELENSLSQKYIQEDTSAELAKFLVQTEPTTTEISSKKDKKVKKQQASKEEKPAPKKEENLPENESDEDSIGEYESPELQPPPTYYPWGCNHTTVSDFEYIVPTPQNIYFTEIQPPSESHVEEISSSVANIYFSDIPQQNNNLFVDEGSLSNLNSGIGFTYVK